MKLKTLFLLLTLPVTLFSACDSDDDNTNSDNVPEEVRNTFAEKYPSAINMEWENKGLYKVVEFTYNNMEAEAWFDSNGTWYMTETDLPYNLLPQAVKDSFQASEYSTWKIDDIDMLERKDSEAIYIIEAEQQNNEMDLYYSTEGILIKTIADYDNTDYESHLPQTIPTEIKTFIETKYPKARIIETEYEKNKIEIDIIHDNTGKEVVFDTNAQWLYTSWDVKISALPRAVLNIMDNAEYTGYHIDDAEFVETSQGDYYLLELEKGNNEIKVKADKNGNILS